VLFMALILISQPHKLHKSSTKQNIMLFLYVLFSVVAGDHANNDMAGDDEDSWKSMFVAADAFDSVDCQIEGLGRIKAVQDVMLHIPRQLLREAIRHTATERQRSLTDLIYPYRRWMRNSILH